MSIQAYIVRLIGNEIGAQGGRKGTQTMVHAASEEEAKQRGAATLDVSPFLVEVVSYDGPTLGSL